jgi:hypothetical protein
VIKVELAIETLVKNNVEFVIVGGIAITAHGSAYITKDLDFCYLRSKENLKNIVAALALFNPRPRGFPENLPYIFDETTLQNATNFTFETELGDIDLLGEVAGVGNFAEVEASSVLMDLFDCKVKVLSIEGLILAKRAAGRPKDLLVLPELEAMQEILLKQDDAE